MKSISLTILIPCFNEEDTIAECIATSLKFLKDNKINGEVLVIDNNSTDNSFKIAQKTKARVILELKRGYGNALRRGIKEAKGKFIIMLDADCSYDIYECAPFLEKLNHGYDLIVGNRFLGGIETGAMSFSHKYVGNPILSFIGKKIFKVKLNDFHCGLRGFNKEKMASIIWEGEGMEFATEMIIKCQKNKLNMCEIPIKLHKDKRINTKSKLKTFRDGWRHLRIMINLLFSK